MCRQGQPQLSARWLESSLMSRGSINATFSPRSPASSAALLSALVSDISALPSVSYNQVLQHHGRFDGRLAQMFCNHGGWSMKKGRTPRKDTLGLQPHNQLGAAHPENEGLADLCPDRPIIPSEPASPPPQNREHPHQWYRSWSPAESVGSFCKRRCLKSCDCGRTSTSSRQATK